MLRLFEVGARAARGVVVRRAGMERSQFLVGEVGDEVYFGYGNGGGYCEVPLKCAKHAGSGFER